MSNYYSEMTELGRNFHAFIIKAIKQAAKDYYLEEEIPTMSIVDPSQEELESVEAEIAERSFSDFTESREINEALDSLPADLKSIVNLYYIQGYNNKSICEFLGISEVTLIKRKNKAINLIKDELTAV